MHLAGGGPPAGDRHPSSHLTRCGYLRDSGQCRAHRIPNPDGGHIETGGLDIAEFTHQLVDAMVCRTASGSGYGPPVESCSGHRDRRPPARELADTVTGDMIARRALSAAVRTMLNRTKISWFVDRHLASVPIVCTISLCPRATSSSTRLRNCYGNAGTWGTSPTMIQKERPRRAGQHETTTSPVKLTPHRLPCAAGRADARGGSRLWPKAITRWSAGARFLNLERRAAAGPPAGQTRAGPGCA